MRDAEAAAEALFSQKPYAEVTLRDITKAMKMSTGAVFANFGSKGELFAEIMVMAMKAQYDRMLEAGVQNKSLYHIIVQLYEEDIDRLELVRCRFGVLWMWTAAEPGLQKYRKDIRRIEKLMFDLVARFFYAGEEESKEKGAKLRASVFWAMHRDNYYRLQEGVPIDDIRHLLQEQIDLIMKA